MSLFHRHKWNLFCYGSHKTEVLLNGSFISCICTECGKRKTTYFEYQLNNDLVREWCKINKVQVNDLMEFKK